MKTLREFITEKDSSSKYKKIGELNEGDTIYFIPDEDSDTENKIYSAKISKIRKVGYVSLGRQNLNEYYLEKNGLDVEYFDAENTEDHESICTVATGWLNNPKGRRLYCLVSTSREFFKEYFSDENNRFHPMNSIKKLNQELEKLEEKKNRIMKSIEKLEYQLTKDFLES